MTAADDDITVLRGDHSVTASSGKGRGGVTAPKVLKQRFVLEDKLGSGGMGTVFRAKDLRKVEARDRQPFVAVKVLNNDFREHPEAFIALQREAAKSQVLSHRNIVSIYDFDKDGDVPFIVMELLEGQELAELLRAFPTGLPDDVLWPIVRCMCDGLEHAHEAGLVHADFKPGNVLVSPTHTAKILDFGIARAVRVNPLFDDDTVFDPSRLAAMTPAYASPQMLDGAEAQASDDLFSLGVVIYLMLTGRHPYDRTPANEAERQQLRPQRPHRLSRRQWRVLERCLAFDREKRPESVAELTDGLFQPSPWRSRSVLVAILAIVGTFAVSGLKEDAAVQEAKVEVRQTTLVAAQRARLESLLAAPRFDVAWEASVAEELAALRALQPDGQVNAALPARIRQIYDAEVRASADPDTAIAIYRRGLAFGSMPKTAAYLRERLAGNVSRLLDAPVLEADWLDDLDVALARFEQAFPDSPQPDALRLEAVDVLEVALAAPVSEEAFPAARRALAYLETYSFNPQTVERLRIGVDDAERALLARREAVERDAARQDFAAELSAALSGSCLEFDPAPAAAVLRRWIRLQPAFGRAGRAQIGEAVTRCLAQLEAVDRERALELRTGSARLFGSLPGLKVVREDPCGASYLVGTGSQSGRRGSCVDRVADTGQGPRLVVVPASEQGVPFAITRQEVSWAEMRPFCQETGRCVPEADDLPVRNIGVDLARDYAAWLTERTGFSYRLPTYREWLQAAAGTTDPNRNCQVQLGGVHRGLAPVAAGTGTPNPFGLVNVLGNVQEWVIDVGEIKAAGGAFRDPIADCAVTTLRAHRGAADPATGFRLVREVS